MTRTFIALDLHEDLQRFLGETISRGSAALPSVRWVAPASIHLTLAFLGELNDKELGRAFEAAGAAARQAQPFSYSLSAPGTFGSPRAPRVIWMGIEEPSGALQTLHRALNRELKRRGFEVEKRPFSPHLTLARIKGPLSPEELETLQHFLADARVHASLPAHAVESLRVMKSELARTGAIYTCLRVYPLTLSPAHERGADRNDSGEE